MCPRSHRQDPPAQVEHARLPERTASTPGAILAYSSICLHFCTVNTPPRSADALRDAIFAISIHFLCDRPLCGRSVGLGLGISHALCRYLAANNLVGKGNGQLPEGPVAAELVVDGAEGAEPSAIDESNLRPARSLCDRCRVAVSDGVVARRHRGWRLCCAC